MTDRWSAPARIAVDLLGGDGGPAAVGSAIASALRRDPVLQIIAVGPEQQRRPLFGGAAGDIDGRLTFVTATEAVGMGEDPIPAVRAKPDATVCVAARLVRQEHADAMVSVGSTGAAMAAAIFSLDMLAGLTRPALAVTVPAVAGDVVLLDVGANVVPAVDLLVQHAVAGAAYARARLGIDRPRVGLLTIGAEDGKGDRIRRAAGGALAALPICFVGNVEGDRVPLGGVADVVVTDGFTGNVLLKGMEGTLALLSGLVTSCLQRENGSALRAVREATAHLHHDRLSGALLLGVDAIVVVGHGASSADGVAACIALAADEVRRGVLGRVRAALTAPTTAPGRAALTEVTP